MSFLTNLPVEIDSIEDNKENLTNLIEQLKTPFSIIPFVGAGLSIPFGFPGWGGFLIMEAKKADIESKIQQRLQAAEYEEAAEDLRIARGYRAFHDAISNTFGRDKSPKEALSEAVHFLPYLTSGPVITTNFDHVLEQTFRQANNKFENVVCGAKADLAYKAMIQNRRFLLKIHGDADDSTERILRKTDYEKHYGSVDGSSIDVLRPLPQLLAQLLITRPLLFLGCSLNKDRTILVLEAVAHAFRAIIHYAIVEQPLKEEFHEHAKFLSNHNIRPIWYPYGKHSLVTSILKGLVSVVASSRDVRISRVPSINSEASGVAQTNIVRFETERRPRVIELQKAVHMISAAKSSEETFRVPLEYDARISTLLKKLDLHSAHLGAHFGVISRRVSGLSVGAALRRR